VQNVKLFGFCPFNHENLVKMATKKLFAINHDFPANEEKKRLDIEYTLDFDLYGITSTIKPLQNGLGAQSLPGY